MLGSKYHTFKRFKAIFGSGYFLVLGSLGTHGWVPGYLPRLLRILGTHPETLWILPMGTHAEHCPKYTSLRTSAIAFGVDLITLYYYVKKDSNAPRNVLLTILPLTKL